MVTASMPAAPTGLFLQQPLDLGLYRFQRCTLRRVWISREIASHFFESVVVARKFHIHIDQHKTGTVFVVIDFQSLAEAYPCPFKFADFVQRRTEVAERRGRRKPSYRVCQDVYRF